MKPVLTLNKKGKVYLKRKEPKKKEKSISRLVKELDAIFSRFIRLFYAQNGTVRCFTCPYVAPVSKMHAGHYLSRFYKITRWNENNVKPQCPMCNLWRKGNAVVFRENLVKEMGEEKVKFLEKSRHDIFKLDRIWLLEEIAYYKMKVLELEHANI